MLQFNLTLTHCVTSHELTRVCTCISYFNFCHKILWNLSSSCSLYYKKRNCLYWYLGFHRNFNVTKISVMTDRDGEELFNELHADALSDCPSDFEIYRCGNWWFIGRQLRIGYQTSETANLQNLLCTIARRRLLCSLSHQKKKKKKNYWNILYVQNIIYARDVQSFI